jgi:hypothetical protein
MDRTSEARKARREKRGVEAQLFYRRAANSASVNAWSAG